MKRMRRRLLPACYIAAAAAWLLWALFCLCWQAAVPETSLNAEEALPVNAARGADGALHTEGGDAQLVFGEVNAPLRTVLLEADFGGEPGELDVFYTRRAGEAFSVRRRAIGAPQHGGGVLYTLPPGYVSALRVDLGTAGGNSVRLRAVTLNPRRGAAGYLVPDLRGALGLAVWPALACCAIYTIMDSITAAKRLRARRRGRRGAGDGA